MVTRQKLLMASLALLSSAALVKAESVYAIALNLATNDQQLAPSIWLPGHFSKFAVGQARNTGASFRHRMDLY